ncbi:MAG: NifU family protein, partial [Cytophagales bacterium]|nr:NifU family protein [Cytophagales bacterium]
IKNLRHPHNSRLRNMETKLIAEIENLLDRSLRPYLRVDGGDIRIVSLKHHVLRVELLGACETCPMSKTTMKLSVESVIKNSFPQILEVLA